MPANNHWSDKRWDELCKQFCADHGPVVAAKIIQTIVNIRGGERITIPSIQDLERRERDRKIFSLFWGEYHGDYQAIALRFGISEATVRRIILKQRILERLKDEEYSP